MLKFCLWILAAIGLWIGGLLLIPPHREIRTLENGRLVMRASMPSPSAATLVLWMLSAFAGVCAFRSARRRSR